MITRPCIKCNHPLRVDDTYSKYCKNGVSSKKCICGHVNHIYFGMDGKIKLTKQQRAGAYHIKISW